MRKILTTFVGLAAVSLFASGVFAESILLLDLDVVSQGGGNYDVNIFGEISGTDPAGGAGGVDSAAWKILSDGTAEPKKPAFPFGNNDVVHTWNPAFTAAAGTGYFFVSPKSVDGDQDGDFDSDTAFAALNFNKPNLLVGAGRTLLQTQQWLGDPAVPPALKLVADPAARWFDFSGAHPSGKATFDQVNPEVVGGPGDSPGDPILPDNPTLDPTIGIGEWHVDSFFDVFAEFPGGGWGFDDVSDDPKWYDPEFQGYYFETDGQFASVALPDGTNGTLRLSDGAGGWIDSALNGGAAATVFDPAVEEFMIIGLTDPPIDPTDQAGFPVQLSFVPGGTNFNMVPIPEPSTVLLMILGVLGIVPFFRRRK